MTTDHVLDPALKEFGTPRQGEYVDAVNAAGSITAAAKALMIDGSALRRMIRKLKAKAASQGYAPGHWADGVAPGYRMGKVTVQRGPNGVERVWERQHPELDPENLREMVAAFVSPLDLPNVPAAPLDYDSDIIPWINIGDAHLGLLCHAAEVGENFDLKIAERELLCAISTLIDELPACERLVINDLGDFTHYENFTGTTEASGHALDFDTRFPKMIRVYSRTMRAIIEKALTKARHVDVLVNQGNHSRTNDIWMAELLRVAYAGSDRVHVLDNENIFTAYRMGKTLVMVHHSDKCRPKDLVGVMTSDFRKDFGETEYHYIYIGHIHHGMVMKEHPSVIIESFNHLAATDKWAHDNGYRARKCITVTLLSRTYGEVGRRLLPIQEIRDRLAKLPAGTTVLKSREPFRV